MVEALCNKCRAAPPLSGDSWCLACTACESISCELRSRWGSHELRRLAADELVDQSKAIKTLRILSLRLRFEGADRSGARSGPSTGAGVALGATGKAKPGPPPKAPPILKEATGKTPEVIEEEVEVEKYEEESEYSYETSEEEVDTWQEAERPPVERKPESPKKGAGSAEVAEDKKERKRKSRGEEKVESKASKKKEKKDKGEKTRRRGRRGGSKHQQVHRQRHDPGLRVHRKKSVEQLQRYKERKEPPYPPPGKEWRR